MLILFRCKAFESVHLFCPHISFIENAAVKTAAFSRLTTEIPQTDFCFNYLTGTPFQECPSFLFVPILFSASQLISLEVAAISQTVAFSAYDYLYPLLRDQVCHGSRRYRCCRCNRSDWLHSPRDRTAGERIKFFPLCIYASQCWNYNPCSCPHAVL